MERWLWLGCGWREGPGNRKPALSSGGVEVGDGESEPEGGPENRGEEMDRAEVWGPLGYVGVWMGALVTYQPGGPHS